MKRLGLVVSVLAVALVGSLLVRVAIVESEEPLVVVHWSNSHPLREDLLTRMAEQFNDADLETPSGQPIEIRIVRCDSAVQAEDLVGRVTGEAGDHECAVEGERAGDPVIVTPQSDDWLVDINHYAGRDVVDIEQARGAAIAKAYLGIVTYEGMAECLRAARGDVGYADIVELAKDGWDEFIAAGSGEVPRGCPLSTWGDPMLTFTNPSTSTSGRNVLVTLYSMYADQSPGELNPAGIERAEPHVQEFQALVDHYMPTTEALNRKIAESIDEGHFFLMPEDNLVSLVEGNETVTNSEGKERTVEVTDLEMIYPTEGSVLNSNPAALVDADWVSADQLDAANRWIDYLREDEQQEAFMTAGFRPGTDLDVDAAKFERWGLDPQTPNTEIDPGRLRPEILEEIVGSWGKVKKPSVVTFVVDTSLSMERNDAIDQVQEGLRDIVNEMELTGAAATQVGLVTFNDGIVEAIPSARLDEVGDDIGSAITAMIPSGDTALYDAVALGIQLTDEADAPANATRAVVVLSDGKANRGTRCLGDIVEMAAEADREGEVTYCAKDVDGQSELAEARDQDGDEVDPSDVVGTGFNPELNLQHDDLRVFFLGFGDADLNVGRILAGATGADFQESPDDGIAEVILELSGYF